LTKNYNFPLQEQQQQHPFNGSFSGTMQASRYQSKR